MVHFGRFFVKQIPYENDTLYPICSMYGILSYIYHKFMPNVGKYTSPMEHLGITRWAPACYK